MAILVAKGHCIVWDVAEWLDVDLERFVGYVLRDKMRSFSDPEVRLVVYEMGISPQKSERCSACKT